MHNLSENQKKVVNFDEGLAVVRACPGSGKTYSVAARMASLISKNNSKRNGIAALSFTNVACEEIKDKLKDDFGVGIIRSPHFIGTLDTFINQFIFLPFGHLVMGCSGRPTLVGEPHSNWTVKRFERDEYQYFDKTTFDKDGILIPIVPPFAFKDLSWKKFYNKDGKTIHGSFQKIIDAKVSLHQKGFAIQADANYFSLRILQEYPIIADNIANKFSHYIIDEAQDTDEVLMAIVDILVANGASNFMLVGDRDQSIFEWNHARPELFDEKYDQWEKIDLTENRRSSQNICDFTSSLSSFDSTSAVSDSVKDFAYIPEIEGYKRKQNSKRGLFVSTEESIASFDLILKKFLKNCEENGVEISESNVAVLYRGKSKMELLGMTPPEYNFESPWTHKNHSVRTIAEGVFLFHNGNFSKGYKRIEKGYLELIKRTISSDDLFVCKDDFVNELILNGGFKGYREKIFEFIELLPNPHGMTLLEWVNQSNKNFEDIGKPVRLKINEDLGDIAMDSLFAHLLDKKLNTAYYHGTIHSVKGKTYDAVLLVLDKGRPFYVNTMFKDREDLSPEYAEELRMVYVGMTRPRKILTLAVPNEDVLSWIRKCS